MGTEVEFTVTSVNVVGKSSEWSEASPVYKVIGQLADWGSCTLYSVLCTLYWTGLDWTLYCTLYSVTEESTLDGQERVC